jgi:hypothetical protein
LSDSTLALIEPQQRLAVIADDPILEMHPAPIRVAAAFAHENRSHPLATLTFEPADGGVRILASDGARVLALTVKDATASRRLVLPAPSIQNLLKAHKASNYVAVVEHGPGGVTFQSYGHLCGMSAYAIVVTEGGEGIARIPEIASEPEDRPVKFQTNLLRLTLSALKDIQYLHFFQIGNNGPLRIDFDADGFSGKLWVCRCSGT